MAKILGFSGIYTGLSDNSAWTKVYEFGKNLMPIKDKYIQKKYNRMFKKKTKVIRSNEVKSINTDIIVPEDTIILEKGEFVPADGQILEWKDLNFENNILTDIKDTEFDKELYTSGAMIYQGMKVKSGKGIMQATKTGADTFLGTQIKEIDESNKAPKNRSCQIYKYLITILSINLVSLFLGYAIAFFTEKDIKYSIYSGVIMLIATIPVGGVVCLLLRIFRQREELKKVKITLKNKHALFNASKVKVVCVDDKFLAKNYEKCIQNLYKAGIGVLVFSEKGKFATEEIASDAGVFFEDKSFISGDEINQLTEDKLIPVICEKIIFYNINHEQKKKIIKAFEFAKITTLSIGSGLEDLVIAEKSLINISSNNVKRSADREFAKALITENDFKSIYAFIRSGLLIKKYLKFYSGISALFYLPIAVFIIIGIFIGINIESFIIPIFLISFIVVPLIMIFIRKKYNEDEIFNKDKKANRKKVDYKDVQL